MSENRKKLTPYIIAFLAGVVITAIVAFLLLRQPGGTAQAGNAEAGNQTENPQTESAQAEDSSRKGTAGPEADLPASDSTGAAASETAQADPDSAGAGTSETAAAAGRNIDLAAVFPSWNPDSESLGELVAFVADVTDKSSPDYLDPADRLATFDMDGTILSEKAPVYIDYCLTLHRVLDDPDYNATEEERSAMEETRSVAYSEGRTYAPEGVTKDDLISTSFAGMTPEEFRAYVVDFADHTDVVGFEGMTYAESFYQPMLEVIRYLQANDFDVWMVSACEREVVRALVERYDIPYDHVIATDVPYVASGNGEEAADDYNMSRDEEILLGSPLDEVECAKSGKPAAIAREIGKRPILAFGNSAGDYSMLNYAEGNPDHEGMGFFIVCDDTEREYGDAEKAAAYYDDVEKEGWTPFSMADDWKTIYGEGVQKTALPGAEKVQPAAEETQPDTNLEEVQPGTEETQPDSEEEALPDAA